MIMMIKCALHTELSFMALFSVSQTDEWLTAEDWWLRPWTQRTASAMFSTLTGTRSALKLNGSSCTLHIQPTHSRSVNLFAGLFDYITISPTISSIATLFKNILRNAQDVLQPYLEERVATSTALQPQKPTWNQQDSDQENSGPQWQRFF